jgi:hypothetical protein
MQTLKRSIAAIAGGVVSQSVPSLILGSGNTGAMGYVGNLATALIGGKLVGKFVGGDNGEFFLIGGIVMTVGRVIQDLAHKTLVSFGDISTLFSSPAAGVSGDYINASFPVPVSSLGPASKALLPAPSPEVAAVVSKPKTIGAWSSPWAG